MDIARLKICRLSFDIINILFYIEQLSDFQALFSHLVLLIHGEWDLPTIIFMRTIVVYVSDPRILGPKNCRFDR